MRHAGRDLLSLALIDARNQLLRLLAQDESSEAVTLALHAGWYQDWWIARHLQRDRGEACDPRAPRLAGIEPRADAWVRGQAELPAADAARGYLAETLEITLDLLAACGRGGGSSDDDEANDAALHFFRLALLHEDRLCESLAERLALGMPSARAEREPLWLPAQRWRLGSEPGGLVPQAERWAHEVAVPEFEIDGQPVNWRRYAEFADDGGYDRPEFWSDAGWRWVQREGRRAPRRVEQLQGGVLVLRHGGIQRAALGQPVMHVSRHEAEAWCRWAGRRLPTEPEWELAASAGARRGFLWGDVHEWVAGSARPWPGAGTAAPGCIDVLPAVADGEPPPGVLRGASFATRSRRVYPQARRFAAPDDDARYAGFRSCAL
ncbi:MAG: SUMF1/EgtB/PvdO family nonheme iron enzyme [Burkholderiales bacterium]|nr:SUMF1/EgtB/PvdO family nonheme iron enzyme [Burkholderiales bacterium]